MAFLAFGLVVGWCPMASTYDGAARYRGSPCTRTRAWITLALPRPYNKLWWFPGMSFHVLLPEMLFSHLYVMASLLLVFACDVEQA